MEITLATLSEKLDSIAKFTLIGVKTVLDFEETLLFTGLSKGHLYRLTSNKEIPYYRKNRKLYFKKDELERWMLDERCMTNREIEAKATTFCALKKM